MKRYIKQIKKATTENRLNEIIETAAFDDTLTNEEYTELYFMAENILRGWLWGK